MRQRFFVTSLLVTLLASSYSAEAKQPSANWLNRVVGSYQSQIFNKSMLMPGKTTFMRNRNGEVIGNYFIKEGSESVPGTLSQCQAIKTLMLRFTWVDRYGSGDLEVTFSKDFSKFTGRWGEEGLKPQHHWSGAR